MCRRGEDIVLVTLNHIDTMRKLVGDSHYHIILLDTATKTLVDVSYLCYRRARNVEHQNILLLVLRITRYNLE